MNPLKALQPLVAMAKAETKVDSDSALEQKSNNNRLETTSKLYRFSPSLGMAATAKPRLMKEEIGEEAGVFNQTKNLTKCYVHKLLQGRS
ncbi:hypothetical protein CFP56_038999 [Quercus suber]|uniref:Uncharacterized protein n=1 Tax=Quercus suber TaxID=58331 RepID=A0AAW0J0T6_QUESU